jgi:lipopolysaccharide/colanic/teichoic acid biosynthesis glycosyltransferase
MARGVSYKSSTSSAFPRGIRLRKRAVDLVVTVPILLVLSPLLALVAVIVKLTSRGPVLFRQERIGMSDEPFTMLKFRSMVENADDSALREIIQLELAGARVPEARSFKLAGDTRITRVGRILRATSVDELPQLINVVRGDMSLVGPRPALPWEVDSFPVEFRRRTTVPPGITGLWQVNGRSRVGTLDMLRFDLEYVDTWSLSTDLRILLRTLPVVIFGDGAR